MDVPITLAEDEEPDLTWFLGESSDPEERTSVLTEGQYAWKSADVLAAEWYENESAPRDETEEAVGGQPERDGLRSKVR